MLLQADSNEDWFGAYGLGWSLSIFSIDSSSFSCLWLFFYDYSWISNFRISYFSKSELWLFNELSLIYASLSKF